MEDSERLCLLQAADILVWQATKFIKGRCKVGGTKQPRGDFVELVKARHAFTYVHAHDDNFNRESDHHPDQMTDRKDAFFREMFNLPDSWGPRKKMLFIDKPNAPAPSSSKPFPSKPPRAS